MHSFDLHREFYNKPILLTVEEQANPMTVIIDFFLEANLVEARTVLHNLLSLALTVSNTIYDDANERDTAITFVYKIEKLIEASSLL